MMDRGVGKVLGRSGEMAGAFRSSEGVRGWRKVCRMVCRRNLVVKEAYCGGAPPSFASITKSRRRPCLANMSDIVGFRIWDEFREIDVAQGQDIVQIFLMRRSTMGVGSKKIGEATVRVKEILKNERRLRKRFFFSKRYS